MEGNIKIVSAAIDNLLKSNKESIIVAIDGRCASGKTTLSEQLGEIYDCNIFHMDDYFLQPNQRTQERLLKPGENVDHERFLDEILKPLYDNNQVVYMKYDCQSQKLLEPINVFKKKLNIVEGSYSLHPELYRYYDFKIFISISSKKQRERILKRNSDDMAEKFFSIWIPLEEKYFDVFEIEKKADLVI